ncbi:MAG: hypothetical protein AAGH15_07310 [Myxococcota bacterium]
MSHRLLPLFALVLAFAACGDPDVDTFESEGGQAPDPTGIMEGDVVFAGLRPPCVDGRVPGRAVLLLFRNDNPPPPEGGAPSAANLLFVNGDQLFDASDCELPPGSVVTRSASFTWPDIALGSGEADESGQLPGVAYQVRAFYDTDENFDPRFGVRSFSTRGDVSGGAFVSTAAPVLTFRPIPFDHASERPNGQVVRGITVTLAAPVASELPAFERGAGAQAMASTATFSLNPDPAAADQANWELASLRLRLLDPSDPERRESATLPAAGLSLDTSPEGRGFFVGPVDANRDGEGDLHPILGASGVPWLLPIVIAQRARNLVEQSVGIPDVRFIASVRPGFALPPASKTTFAPEIDVTVPPVAIVTTRPDLPQCQIPYAAPGNLAELYEAGPTECQELPTGNYDLIVIGGLAGARVVDVEAELAMSMPELSAEERRMLAAQRTDTGFALEGGALASQSWSVPNELGCPDTAYLPPPLAVNQIDPNPLTACDDPETLQLASQGPAGRFAVVDGNDDDAPPREDTSDGRGLPACQNAFRLATGMVDAVTYVDVPPECCVGVSALCGLPLCPLVARAALEGEGGVAETRELRSEDLDENGRPTCVPFHVPVSCCR